METKKYIVATLVLALFWLNSCQKIGIPEIDHFELGYNNNKIAYLGSDLHIEAEITAEGKIKDIVLEIYLEGEHEDKSIKTMLEEDAWEFDSTYTKFSGLKNTTFHEHIDIPLDADTGLYHFHFIATDLEGNQSSFEEDLHITEPDDLTAPEISISEHPENQEVFNNGVSISISGTITDETALAGLYIGLVRENQNLTDADVNATNTITLLHTHDFSNPLSFTFDASINVVAQFDNNDPPKEITGNFAWQSGNYYILVKCNDAFGGNWSFSSHYPIVINL